MRRRLARLMCALLCGLFAPFVFPSRAQQLVKPLQVMQITGMTGFQVSTVAGKTSVDVRCQFTDNDGKTILERDLKGQVMFFGGNLRATLDSARKAAKLAHDSFAVGLGT